MNVRFMNCVDGSCFFFVEVFKVIIDMFDSELVKVIGVIVCF